MLSLSRWYVREYIFRLLEIYPRNLRPKNFLHPTGFQQPSGVVPGGNLGPGGQPQEMKQTNYSENPMLNAAANTAGAALHRGVRLF